MALLAPGLGATDLELARAGLEAAGVEVRVAGERELPLVGAPAALSQARSDASAALARAHDAFVATRFDEARAIDAAAEVRLGRFGGDPEVARALAELALVAAQSGDPGAMARAARFAPSLTLDPARWSPEVIRRFQAARAADQARISVELHSQPEGAAVFADGVELGQTPLRTTLATGSHAIALSLPGYAPLFDRVTPAGPPLAFSLTRLEGAERLAALRLRLADHRPIDADEVAFAAGHLGADAALAFGPGGALLAGPHLPPSTFASGAVRDRAEAAGRRVASACGIAHTPPERGRARAPLTLRVEAGACIRQVHASLRAGGGPERARVAPVRNGVAALALAAADLPSSTSPYSLEYRLWGETFLGHPSAPLGSEATPLRVLIDADRPPPKPKRWYHKWWIWTIAGGVLTAAAVVTAVTVYQPPTQARLGGP